MEAIKTIRWSAIAPSPASAKIRVTHIVKTTLQMRHPFSTSLRNSQKQWRLKRNEK